jgi:uncharacterized repeat protein (TIGR01451 family)
MKGRSMNSTAAKGTRDTGLALSQVSNQNKCLRLSLLIGVAVLAALTATTTDAGAVNRSNPVERLTVYGQLPLSFEVNRGQTNEQVAFLTQSNGYRLFLLPTGIVLTLDHPTAVSPALKPTLHMTFLNAMPWPNVAGIGRLPGKVNYFIGNDPENWLTDISTYRQIIYHEVYPGIDLIFYGNQGRLELDFRVAPGADPHAVQLGFQGADDLTLDAQGDLILTVGDAPVTFNAPKIYQDIDGKPQHIGGGYVLSRDGKVRFNVTAYDPTRPLIIDPLLVYSTYLGGHLADVGLAIAADGDGNTYITGETSSLDFPTENAQWPTFQGDVSDAFVVKLNATGDRLYATYLGGNSTDSGRGIAVDSDENAYITGVTTNINVARDEFDFPTTPGAFQTDYAGNGDAFVVKLDDEGTLVYSTLLGGGGDDSADDIALDVNRNTYLTGATGSADLATRSAAQANLSQGVSGDAFIAKLDPIGANLVYFTYLGGDENDEGHGIDLDPDGNAYVAGETESDNFPVVDAFQPQRSGDNLGLVASDAFVTKVNADGTAFLYSTYLGGQDIDRGLAVAVDAAGHAYVTGETTSVSDLQEPFPVFHALQSESGGADAFLTKFAPTGDTLVYSTYLGGTRPDIGHDIAVDEASGVYIAGETQSAVADDFPSASPVQEDLNGQNDAFVLQIDPTGTLILLGTHYGGNAEDRGFGIAVEAHHIYLTGITGSRLEFPLENPVQDALAGGADAFAAKLGAVPPPVYRFEYAAKIVCGQQANPEDMRLARGFYATTINVHNPADENAQFFKKLALTYPPGEQRPGQVLPIAVDTLGYDEALATDCSDIQQHLFPDNFPAPYIEGFLVIQSTERLDLMAVYSAAALDGEGRAGTHSSIDVEHIPGRSLPQPADLAIRKRAEFPSVDSTMAVRYIIEVTNHGPVDATNVLVQDTLTVELGTLLELVDEFTATHAGTWMVVQETPITELTATIPHLPASETATLTFAVRIRLDLNELQAVLVNTATVTSDIFDLNLTNNTMTIETQLALP